MRRLAFALLLTMTAPVFAQPISPAIEADGSQTQSLEVLDGSVSVSVESSGSLSLGQGGLSTDGALGVSVNDVSVGVGGGSDTPAAAAPAPSSQGEGSNPGSVIGGGASSPTAISTAQTGATAPGEMQDGGCNFTRMNTAIVTQALDAGLPVRLEMTECPVVDPTAGKFASQNAFILDLLTTSGVAPESVKSITISNDHVIVNLGR